MFLEVVAVIAVGFLLISILVMQAVKAKQKTRDAQRKTSLSELRASIESFANDYGHFPETYDASDGEYKWFSYCNYQSEGWKARGFGVWIPEILEKGYVKLLPLDPLRKYFTGAMKNKVSDGGVSDSASFCYIYRSDGFDYKLASYCGTEYDLAYPSQQFNKGLNNWSCGLYSYALYSPGAYNW